MFIRDSPKAQPTVDMKPIIVTLMERLAEFLTASAEDGDKPMV